MHGDRSERERLFDEFLEWSDALGLDERIDDLAVLDEHEGWDVAHVKLFLDAGIFVEVAACEDKLVGVLLGKLSEEGGDAFAVDAPHSANGKEDGLGGLADDFVIVLALFVRMSFQEH